MVIVFQFQIILKLEIIDRLFYQVDARSGLQERRRFSGGQVDPRQDQRHLGKDPGRV